MGQQTLRSAIRSLLEGDADLGAAAAALDGRIIGDSAETSAAFRRLNACLPRRKARAYTAEEFAAAVYDVVEGRYRARPATQLREQLASAAERAQQEQDMAVLRHARVFGMTTYDPPSEGGGTVLAGVGTVSQARQLASARRLVAAGLLAPVRDAYRIHGSTAQAHAPTDAGRAAVRAYDGLGELTMDRARSLSDRDLTEIWGDVSLARTVIARRAEGRHIVRGALLACGERHTGTGGWHLLPCAFRGRVGWVDSAKGRACLSTAELAPELIEALTVPEQPTGAVAAGTSFVPASVAGSSRVETPVGWSQLLVDVRVDMRDAPATEATEGVTSVLVAWGLQSCYCAPGDAPAAWGLEDREGDLAEEVLREIRQTAAEGLREVELTLLGRLGFAEAPSIRLTSDSCPWDLREVITTSFRESATWEALREAGVCEIAAAAGEYSPPSVLGLRVIDRIARTFESVLEQRLLPVEAALGDVGEGHPDSPLSRGRRREVLRTAAVAVAQSELRSVHERMRTLDSELRALLTSRGAVVTGAGRALGVTVGEPPAKPVATAIELPGGVPAYVVPFGADCPAEYDHTLVLTVDHSIRIRCADRDAATPARLLGLPTP
jgi:hypothetical protein